MLIILLKIDTPGPLQTFTSHIDKVINQMKPDIYHVELIGSGSLSVMAKPVSGEWIEDEFMGIHDWGINRIVSLLERHEEVDLGLREERALANKFDIEFVSYPIPDRGLPESVQEYLQFTKSLYHESTGGLNTVVHPRFEVRRIE